MVAAIQDIKLSEHMRLGIPLTRPLRSDFFKKGYKLVYACAIGTAVYHKQPEVVEVEYDVLDSFGFDEAEQWFPELLELIEMPSIPQEWPFTSFDDEPYEPGDYVVLGRFIAYLNDTEKWDRRRIANLVESLGY